MDPAKAPLTFELRLDLLPLKKVIKQSEGVGRYGRVLKKDDQYDV